METASFGFSTWHARGQWLALVLISALFLILTGMTLWALLAGSNWVPLWQSVFMLALCAWVLLGVAQWIRYRHFLYHRYTVDSNGVRVESSAGTYFVPWVKLRVAEYLPLYSMVRLSSDEEMLPIVLPLIRGGFEAANAETRNKLARLLIEAGIGRPLARRWLW